MLRLLLIGLLFWLTMDSGLAQTKATDETTTVFRLDSLPPQGILLDKGWKWQAGDNPDWAKPEFDDSRWESIAPTKDIHDLPQVQKASIGWFRLHLQVDSTLFQQQVLTLFASQVGASELYSNGRLIKRFGTISPNADQVDAKKIFPQQIGLPQTAKGAYVLAVRIACQANLPSNKFANSPNSVYRLRVFTDNEIYTSRRAIVNVFTYSKAGIFFILAFLHVCFFIFYPPQKANLFFAISALIFFQHWLCFGLVQNMLISDLDTVGYLGVLRGVLYPFGYLFLVTALYSAYALPKSTYYWLCIVASGLLLIIYWLDYHTGVVWLEIGSTLVMTAEALRITILAVIRNQRGSTIILVGMVLSLLGLCLRYLIDFSILLPTAGPSPNVYSITIETFGTICIPLFISAYLASEFAFTAKSLAAQLVAVEQLSAQTIIQQKEKQQLLTQQNETLEKQVEERTSKLNHSLENLKATQIQLIQKEKMASLGELTAGIAHEIQNPLNFVNNFSEVSSELVGELEEEAQVGNMEEVKAIAGDLRQNLQKITQHGIRASSIVKGMLEHSRTVTGERQSTDLNALCEEYLRLAYHGFRAKDKEFNAELKTNFDSTLSPVEVVPQEIGRVLLNLYNNAFYATQQRKQQSAVSADYQPTVTVCTKRVEAGVEIRVGDNGTGIPEAVRAKIFQPFFTTKPTGEGTGLGLSLSYDIVTKGHGGMLTVESVEGEGTMFIIQLQG